MRNRTKIVIAVVILAVAAGTTVAWAMNSDDDIPITGPALAKATEAALEYTGGGTVTDTEIEDEESYYEVEVTLDDGTQIDVQLDEDFNVVGSEEDTEEPDDDDND